MSHFLIVRFLKMQHLQIWQSTCLEILVHQILGSSRSFINHLQHILRPVFWTFCSNVQFFVSDFSNYWGASDLQTKV